MKENYADFSQINLVKFCKFSRFYDKKLCKYAKLAKNCQSFENFKRLKIIIFRQYILMFTFYHNLENKKNFAYLSFSKSKIFMKYFSIKFISDNFL